MRNTPLLQFETKIGLSIILIIVIIFLVTIFRNTNKFNKFIDQSNIEQVKYEEIRLQKKP